MSSLRTVCLRACMYVCAWCNEEKLNESKLKMLVNIIWHREVEIFIELASLLPAFMVACD